MAYFEPYIDAEGIHVPTYGDIMEYLQGQYRMIFGDDVYLGEETPDYQIMSIFAKCLEDFSALAIESYNNRDPQYASADALDTLVQFVGMTRRASTASTVTLTLTGDSGTLVEAGKQAIDENGNLWTIDEDVTIPAEETVTVGATCETLGAIVAPVGFIDGIYTPTVGWYGVTNAVAAEPGLNTETDAELRLRFMEAHAVTNSGIADSIISGLRSISGVTFTSLVENDTGSTDANGLPGHSFCAIVEGGEDDDVAEKLFYLKPPGVATYGSTSVTVVDEYGNSNTVNFSRPTSTDVAITVTIKTLSGYDADRVNGIIKNSLIEDVNNLGIGKNWNVTMGYKDIYSAFSNEDIPISIKNISATKTGGSSTTTEVSCDYDETLNTKDTIITITVDNT